MITYFSPVPWHSFDQRPHAHVRWIHERTGRRVLWLEPYVTRLPKSNDFGNLLLDRKKFNGSTPDWLEVKQIPALPIEPIGYGRAINSKIWGSVLRDVIADCRDRLVIAGKPSGFLSSVISAKTHSRFLFDFMDQYAHFYQGLSKTQMLKSIAFSLHTADYVSFSSQELRNAFQAQVRGEFELISNGFSDQHAVKRSNHVGRGDFGYIGTVSEWFDFDFLKTLAAEFPENRIRIIGPRHVKIPRNLGENISFEPPVSHSQAMEQMATFSLGLIPFKRSELTRYVDPVKYHEYRHFGIPVLSSSFGEMNYRAGDPGLVLVNPDEAFPSSAINTLINQGTTAKSPYIESWSSRFDASKIMASALGL